MVFNSLGFLVFFGVILLVLRIRFAWTGKKIFLLFASYLLYAGWNPPFVALLWISTFVDWHAARWIASATGRWQRRLALCFSLGTNLGLLCFFKYGQFLVDNCNGLLAATGLPSIAWNTSIYLPIGISFYTFQTLSYTIDVYRGRLEPARSPLDFALYVAFFPQLVAGPIVRATDFLPQCLEEARASFSQISWGCCLLTLGCFQKVCLADNILAPVVDDVYQGALQPTFSAAWLGTLAFAGQIFFDFSGYSTCAIGVAMAMGFRLPDNFRCPYAASGFSDFWRRWHISLSSWLRDYLYIPLGGNRVGPTRTQVNLMLTMLLGGLWHGPAWTFVVWGALHGLLLSVERAFRSLPLSQWAIWRTSVGQIISIGVTFVAICFTWVFFRATTFAQAGQISSAMLGYTASGAVSPISKFNMVAVGTVVGLMLLTHFALRHTNLESVAQRMPAWLLILSLVFMLFCLLVMQGQGNAFIYFQF